MRGRKPDNLKESYRRKKDFQKRLLDMKHKTRLLDDLRSISNAILANGCYSEIEKEKQQIKGKDMGKLTDQEKKCLDQAWDMRQKLAGDLIKEMNDLKKDFDIDDL